MLALGQAAAGQLPLADLCSGSISSAVTDISAASVSGDQPAQIAVDDEEMPGGPRAITMGAAARLPRQMLAAASTVK
jgi:hypothetical protein